MISINTTSDVRVLFCSNAYPPRFIGGAELIAEKYANALRGMGYEAAVFAGDGQGAWGLHYAMRREDWKDIPVWRVQLGCQDFANTGVNFVNRPVEERFEEVLDAFRPTVVHCHNLIGLSVQLLHLAKRRGLRTGLTLHDHWMYCPRNTLMTPDGQLCHPRSVCTCQKTLSYEGDRELPVFLRDGMMRTIVRDIDFFHFPSSYLHGSYLRWGLPPQKCRVIPYGIELDRFASIQRRREPDRVRLTFAGYVGHHKGIDLLVDAFAATPENPRLYLNIVGTGELRKPLTVRVKQMGIADRVKFWDKVPNDRIGEVYEQTDCLVLPSVWPENHPVSINEAFACGIPVIASNSGGIPEMVTHCRTGYLFEQGNRAELQQLLSHVARNPDCLDLLSENARRESQRFSIRRTILQVLDLYRPDTTAAHGEEGRFEPSIPVASRSHYRLMTPCAEGNSPPAHSEPSCVTILCIGDHFHRNCAEVVKRLECGPFRSRVRLLWSDWIYESQNDGIDVFWVLDRDSFSSAWPRDGALLLLPEDHRLAPTLAYDNRTFLYRDETVALAIIETAVETLSRTSAQAAPSSREVASPTPWRHSDVCEA